MKRWHKYTLVALLILGAVTVAGYLNRTALILAYVAYSRQIDIAENQPINWQRGPAEPSARANERPPNIIFIPG